MTAKPKVIKLDYEPQAKQRLLHETAAKQILYGGAASGGKTHALRWDAIAFCLQNPKLDAYLFRRTLPELRLSHINRIKDEIPAELGHYSEREDEFRWFNGSLLHFCYCEYENDVRRYQSAEFHWLGLDEGTHFTEFQIAYLRGRVRLGAYSPPQKHLLPRIVIATNPGGPGHHFVKRTFIEPAPPMTIFYDESMADPADANDKGWPTIYIPARMADNKFTAKNYAGQFKSLPPEMAKALIEGDWDVVAGAALHNLSRERHQLRPFVPPLHWTRIMSIDWGSAEPFSVGWYCVCEGGDGAILKARDGWPERTIPEGAVIRYAEWYGWTGKPNQGIRLSAKQVAVEILRKERERHEPPIDIRIGDYQMWAQHDGPSVREAMWEATDGRIALRQSKKDRKANYSEITTQLAGNAKYHETGEEWEPMFYVTADCTQWWRMVPVLTLDEVDMDKGPGLKQENHAYDETAYALTWRLTRMRAQDRHAVEPERMDPYATR